MNNAGIEQHQAYRLAPLGVLLGQSSPRLYDRVVEGLRARHYSRRTEGLHPLDSPLHPVLRLSTSARSGGGGREPFAHRSGGQRKNVMLPGVSQEPLQDHLRGVRGQHEADVEVLH